MIDDVTALASHCLGSTRVTLDRHSHGVDRERDLPLGKEAHQAPKANTAAIFIGGFHVEIAPSLDRRMRKQIGEPGLRERVAVQHRAFATFLIVEDEVDGNPRPTRPTRIRWLVGVTDEIAWILGHRRQCTCGQNELSAHCGDWHWGNHSMRRACRINVHVSDPSILRRWFQRSSEGQGFQVAKGR